jgi:hypothetical protein
MQVDKNNFDSQTPEQSADQDIRSRVLREHERVRGSTVDHALIPRVHTASVHPTTGDKSSGRDKDEVAGAAGGGAEVVLFVDSLTTSRGCRRIVSGLF